MVETEQQYIAAFSIKYNITGVKLQEKADSAHTARPFRTDAFGA